MEHLENIIARYLDGRILKGTVRDFSRSSDIVLLEEAGHRKEHQIPINQLKAIFFVQSLGGDSSHRERKAFGIGKNIGRKAFIKFNDGETMLGFIDGDFPWKKGFSLTKPDDNAKGFYLIPVDDECNNKKIFIVANSVKDVAIMTGL